MELMKEKSTQKIDNFDKKKELDYYNYAENRIKVFEEMVINVIIVINN